MLTSSHPSVESSPKGSVKSVLVLEPVRQHTDLDSVPLVPGKYTIGSSNDCTLRLHAPGVQPNHCMIVTNGTHTILKAWDSRTWLNEGPVKEASLSEGDHLVVGPVEFRICATTVSPQAEKIVTNMSDDDVAVTSTFNPTDSEDQITPTDSDPATTANAERQDALLKELLTSVQEQAEELLHQRRESLTDQRVFRDELSRRRNDVNIEAAMLRGERHRLKSLHTELDNRENRITTRESQITTRESEFDSLDCELNQRQKEIETQIAEFDLHSEQWRVENDARKIAFGKQLSVLAERETSLGERERQIDQRLEKAEAVEAETESSSSAIDEMRNEEFDRELETREKELETALGHLEDAKQEFNEQLEARETAMSRREEEVAALRQKVETSQFTAEKEWQEVKAAQETIAEERFRFEERESRLTDAEKEIEEELENIHEEQGSVRQQKQELESRLEELEQKQQELEQADNALSERADVFTEQEHQIAEERQRMESETLDLSEQRDNLQQDLRELQAARNKLEVERQKIEESRSEIEAIRESLEAACDETPQPVEEESTLVENALVEPISDEMSETVCEESASDPQQQNLMDSVRAEEENSELTPSSDLAVSSDEPMLAKEQTELENEFEATEETSCPELDVLNEVDNLVSELASFSDDATDEVRGDILSGEEDGKDLYLTDEESSSPTDDLSLSELLSSSETETDIESFDDSPEGFDSLGTTEEPFGNLDAGQLAEGFESDESSAEPEPTEDGEREDLRSTLATMFDMPEIATQESSSDSEDLDRENDDLLDADELESLTSIFESIDDDLAEENSEDSAENLGDIEIDADSVAGRDDNSSDNRFRDFVLEDAEDPNSIDAYMQKLLERSRRRSDGDTESSTCVLPSSPESITATTNEREQSPADVEEQNVTSENPADLGHDFSDENVSTESESGYAVETDLAPRHPIDRESARANLDSLREVANLSARSAIATYSSRQMRGMLVVKSCLTTVSFGLAVVLLTSDIWGDVSYKFFGWAALAVGMITAMELTRSALAIHRMKSFANSSIHLERALDATALEKTVAEDADDANVESNSPRDATTAHSNESAQCNTDSDDSHADTSGELVQAGNVETGHQS